MKFLHLYKFILSASLLLAFTACNKENLDVNNTQEDPVVTQVTTCDNWQMVITDDGNGTLRPVEGGGTAPYTYEWSTGETTESITVDEDGTYSLTITDDEGCTIDNELTIVLSSMCEGFLTTIEEQPQGSGNLFANVIAGTAPYTYIRSTEETTSSITVNAGGTYSVSVTDQNGCMVESEITIQIGQPCASFECNIGFNLNPTMRSLICDASGGTQPYEMRDYGSKWGLYWFCSTHRRTTSRKWKFCP